MKPFEKIEHEIMLPLIESLEKALVRLRAATQDGQLEADGWIKHTGDVCPVHGLDEVLFMQSDDDAPPISGRSCAASKLYWEHDGDITHYKVTKKHDIHAENKALYAQDALTHDKPWELWEVRFIGNPEWEQLLSAPVWGLYSEYRRKPKPAKKLVDWSCPLLKGCAVSIETFGNKRFEFVSSDSLQQALVVQTDVQATYWPKTTALRLLPPATPTSGWQVYHQDETNLKALHDAGFVVEMKYAFSDSFNIVGFDEITYEKALRMTPKHTLHYRVIGIREGFTDVPESET